MASLILSFVMCSSRGHLIGVLVVAVQLVSFHSSRGQRHEALLVAQAACEGGFPDAQAAEKKKPLDLRRNDLLPTVNHVKVESNKK